MVHKVTTRCENINYWSYLYSTPQAHTVVMQKASCRDPFGARSNYNTACCEIKTGRFASHSKHGFDLSHNKQELLQ